jgi:hypothetical protein
VLREDGGGAERSGTGASVRDYRTLQRFDNVSVAWWATTFDGAEGTASEGIDASSLKKKALHHDAQQDVGN